MFTCLFVYIMSESLDRRFVAGKLHAILLIVLEKIEELIM